jgi:signal transduction histidine kinase
LAYSIIHDVTKRIAAETKNQQNARRLKAIEKILKLYDNPGDELWRYALQKAVDLTDSEIGFVFTYSEQDEEFTFKLYNDEALKTCKSSVMPRKYKLTEVALLAQVIKNRDCLIINDYKNTTFEKHKLPAGHMPIDRFLLVPIFSSHQIVAVVAVANKTDEYTNEDVSQLSLLMDTVWNVVQRKEAESKVFLRNQQLSEIIMQKDKLLSIIAHDIRNPFTTLMGMSELLDRRIETQPMEKNKRMVKVLRESILDILNLFENLLEWAQIQTKGTILSIKSMPVSPTLEAAVRTYGKFAELKNISINAKADEDFSVYADERALDMILRNLISNAVKFTNAGGSIELCAENDGNGYVKLKVCDTGIGIPEKIQQSLFSFTGDSPRSGTSGERGSGIGLALCYDFIALMNGKIHVKSIVGQGTCFEIWLPMVNNSSYVKQNGEE